MLIAIPTLGRVNRQRTWAAIPPFWRRYTRFFVQQHELEAHRARFGEHVIPLPKEIKDVATTRDFIIDFCTKGAIQAVLMMDDDLDFAWRRNDDPTKFRDATEEDINTALCSLDAALNAHAHVGMSAREGANRQTAEWLTSTRAMRVLGYRVDYLTKFGFKFAPATFMCDFHMTLEFLKKGYPNQVYNWMVHNQPGSNNVPGGCTGQRTPETQAAAAHWLAEHHSPYVTVVKKTTKTSWGGEERTDVRVQWKAAWVGAGPSTDPEVLDRREGGDTEGEATGEAETLEQRPGLPDDLLL